MAIRQSHLQQKIQPSNLTDTAAMPAPVGENRQEPDEWGRPVGKLEEPFLFGRQAQMMAALMRQGESVCLIGEWGSGRTSVLHDVARELELTGVTVLQCRGHRLLREHPYSALSQMVELPAGAPQTNPVTIATALARQLSATRPLALIVDNMEWVDQSSLAVISLLKERLEVPIGFSATHLTQDRAHFAELDDSWNMRRIVLQALRFEQVADLAELSLDGPVQRELVSQLFTQSAGNPRLLRALLHTGIKHGLITKQDGLWIASGPTLWHTDLLSPVESLLAPLSKSQRETMFLIGLMAPCSVSDMERHLDFDTVRDLELAGLVTLSTAGASLVSLTPPLLVDYVRYEATQGQRRQARAALSSHSDPAASGWLHTGQPLAAQSHMDLEVAEDATLAHLFDEQAGLRAEALWRMWQQTHSPLQGVAYLRAVWDTAIPDAHSAEVLAQLVEADFDDPWLGLQVASMRAEWLAHRQRDISAGLAALTSFGEARPEMAVEAAAYGLFIQATLGEVPSGYRKQLPLTGDEPTGSILAIVRAFLDLASMEPAAALDSLELMPSGTPSLLEGLAQMIRVLALHHLGRADEAHEVGLQALREARRRLDKPGILAIGYGMSLLLYQEGRWVDAEQLMGSVFSAGRPGMVTAPLYAALLRLAAFLSVQTGRNVTAEALIRSADGVHADESAMPGMSSRLSKMVRALIDGDREAATRQVIDNAKEQMRRGYLLSALSSSRIALGIGPNEEALELLESITTQHGGRDYSVLIEITRAAIERNGSRVRELVEKGVNTGDVALTSSVLESTLLDLADNPAAQQEIAEANSILRERYPGARFREDLAPKSVEAVLSEREFEIALLVDSLDNQEIADRLGISARTVENHIYNAMKKAAVQDRAELFSFAAGRLRSEVEK